MRYKIMYRCSMCDEKFHKGVLNINKKIQNHDYARTANFFMDKMQNYKKTRPAHLCVTAHDSVILKSGIGTFIGLEIEDD